MATIVKILTAGAVLLLVAAKANWTDGYHITVAFVCVIATAILAVGLSLRRGRQPRNRHGREPLLRSIVLGCVAGAAVTGTVATALWVLACFPVSDYYYEQGRAETERVLAALEQAQSYEVASQKIEEQLTKRVSTRWATALRARLADNLVRAGRSAENPSEKRRLWRKASAVARQYGLDSSLADVLLERVNEQEREAELVSKSVELAAQLAEREKKLIAAEFKSLLALGDASTPLTKRQEYYALAKKLADSQHLDSRRAEERLAQVAAAIEKIAPRSLPSTTRVRIQRVSSLPPVGILQISVTDAKGQHIAALLANDFRVLDKSGTRIPACAAEDTVSATRLVHVAIAFDHSASMSGRPLEEAKRALTATLAQLRGAAPIPVFGFSSTVRPITEIQSVVASGGTALYSGIVLAARAIAGREGDKLLLLFTDGRNTVHGPSLDDVISECRSAQIAVHVVALETPELDEPVLRRIATETGGTLAVRDVSSLAAAIKNAATVTRTPFYRLVVPIDALQRSQLRIEVGAGGRVSAACDTLVALHH